MHRLPLDFDPMAWPPELGGAVRPLLEYLPLEPRPQGSENDFPDHFRSRICLDVIHDGTWIPEEFLRDRKGSAVAGDRLCDVYLRERDWGATLVAAELGAWLRLPGFHRVNVARVLMDFGRFPGTTPRHAGHLDRYAINFPFSHLLSYRQKKLLLEHYYDPISAEMDRLLDGKLLKIAIHTYDPYNRSGAPRPPVSLITRAAGYVQQTEMPFGLFDPLFPEMLGEFTADRVLRDRISLTLEKANVPVAHNYPYHLPEGSLEVRYQVWNFFKYLRRCFEGACPETASEPAYRRVWDMLLDTNLRSSESHALRSFLHMFRRVPEALRAEYLAAEAAYEHICAFMERDDRQVVEEYRFSPERASSLVIEVRKDIVFDLTDRGLPERLHLERVRRLTAIIARAIAHYLREDRQPHQPEEEAFERTGPWYGWRDRPIR